MSRAIHVFRSPDRFVAGTVGQPGDRTFYLQAVHEARIISVMLEKQQVQILADRIGALLDEIHRRFGTPIPPPSDRVGDLSPLVMPVDAEFRVGTMGLGWDAESEAVVVELLAITEGEFDESVVLDDTDEGPTPSACSSPRRPPASSPRDHRGSSPPVGRHARCVPSPSILPATSVSARTASNATQS